MIDTVFRHFEQMQPEGQMRRNLFNNISTDFFLVYIVMYSYLFCGNVPQRFCLTAKYYSMKNLFVSSILILALLLQSCHSSSSSSNNDLINHDSKLIDSVKRATEQEIANKLEIQRKNNLRIKIHDSLVADCNKKITALYAELEVQNSKLHDIQRFHFLRTPAEKEMQIRNHLNLVNAINVRITGLKDSLHYFDTNY